MLVQNRSLSRILYYVYYDVWHRLKLCISAGYEPIPMQSAERKKVAQRPVSPALVAIRRFPLHAVPLLSITWLVSVAHWHSAR